MSDTSTHTRSATQLRVSEIFYSLQGESITMGIPTSFIRLTGCPLRCGYCDTTYAFQGGQWLEIEAICHQINNHGSSYVTVTGGEPLAQPNCFQLITKLCDAKLRVAIETSGALDIAHVDSRATIVMDLKTPGSGEMKRNRMENIDKLTHKDQIKIVICDLGDYLWAKSLLLDRGLNKVCEVIMSPSYGQMSPTSLAEWILRDKLPVRFQIQLHKILWGEERAK